MKKKLLTFWLVGVIVLSLVACGSSSASPETTASTEATETTEAATSTEAQEETLSAFDIETGIVFMGDVPNDVTGKWKWATTDKSIDPYDYAVNYCKQYCTNGDEIHAVINTADNTTTCLNYTAANGGSVTVTVRKYVPGEEKDAKILFTGEYIKERIIDIESGYIFDMDEEGTAETSAESASQASEVDFSAYGMENVNIPDSWIFFSNKIEDDRTSISYLAGDGAVVISIMPMDDYGEEANDFLLDAPYTSFEEDDTYKELSSIDVTLDGKKGKCRIFTYQENYYMMTDVFTGKNMIMYILTRGTYDEDSFYEFSHVVDAITYTN